ncbi:MAG: pyruvate:ferredoxin (flavodoxin) oxidoreductase [Tissierellia bacterium]|nr:pyruvate:ferredoxin (flavodoxin) oxidoreductase [Tissierellia bacterium]
MSKVMKTMDGNTAAAHVAYAFTDVACIYPITPSSTMAELIDEWAANGRENIFGQTVKVKEMQSEAGAAGAVHGSLSAGALTSTFTASQGLLLMIPNMYKIAGELLPGVFHVSARALAGNSLSIFGDHQDVCAARQTGFAMLASGSVQEVMDLSAVAHLAAIKGRVPFLNFFDGFRTSHEIQKVEVMQYDDLAKLVDKEALQKFRDHALNPAKPYTKGTAQNPDIYFQTVESANKFYEEIPGIVVEYMNEINKITGRNYKPFVYYGDPEAEYVVVAMGSVTEALEETVDYLNKKGHKTGVVKVHLYRPFAKEYFFDVLPTSVKRICVMDRTKEKGATAEPLHLDVTHSFYDREHRPEIIGVRYGLGSKDVTPSQLNAVFKNLMSDKPRYRSTVGINDDVTNYSLPVDEIIITEPEDTIKCKFWGFGSDGTVGANKQAIKIIGDDTDMYAQGYFSYDSKKSGGITVSHLRFGNNPIKSTYLVTQADFVSCSKQSYVHEYDLLKGLKKGGTFLLSTNWDEKELDEQLPASMKRYIAENDIQFYTIDSIHIAEKIGLGGRTNMINQAAFFKLANIIPIDEAIKALKDSIEKEYGRYGEETVRMNNEAVEQGINALHKVSVPDSWKNAVDKEEKKLDVPEFIENVVFPMTAQEGDNLPVSAFAGREDGHFPAGTSRYEKRGIAVNIPKWDADKCIQCNQCSLVCPHAAIRPFLLNEEEVKNKPSTFKTKKAIGKGLEGLEFKIQVSSYDCTGCGNCADICPAKEKALVMTPFEELSEVENDNWKYAMTVKAKEDLMDDSSVKGSQFKQPYLEFSGACAGCGETAYVKLITQLFGDRMMIANATGCSSIWGASAPSMPYCANQEGRGPSWANSLFEDNAEYGYGMLTGVKQMTLKLEMLMNEFVGLNADAELTGIFKEWLENRLDPEVTKSVYNRLLPLFDKKFDGRAGEVFAAIKDLKDFIIKRSQWIIGGDGWAYDIGFGGLDHVLASGEDVNILVLDTEVYSNTGGQSSKSTPTAAVAKFAASGKRVTKKNLGLMMTSYGYIYVAQIALGANMNHAIKSIKEAESYNGPSIVIAYAPCINHGLRNGMGKSVEQEKFAVESGYWHLFNFDPRLKDEGKNPFTLVSKDPTKPFQDFINSEVRYTSLKKTFPDVADNLFKEAEKDAQERLAEYKRMSAN